MALSHLLPERFCQQMEIIVTGIQTQKATALLKAALALILLAAIPFMTPTEASANNAFGNQFIQIQGTIAPPSGAKDICARYDWACTSSKASRKLSNEDLKTVRTINKKINKQVRSISDQAQYKKPEVWALPTNRGGDCEDFALLKKRELVARGINPSRLLLATVHDRRQGSHAVLILRSDQGDLVLDNLTDRIRTWQETRYTFLRMQNPTTPRKWVAVFAGG